MLSAEQGSWKSIVCVCVCVCVWGGGGGGGDSCDIRKGTCINYIQLISGPAPALFK